MHPQVEHGLADAGDQVDKRDQDHRDQHGSHDDHEIARLDRRQQLLPDAAEGEYLAGDGRGPEQYTEADADAGYHGDDRRA